MAIPVYDHVVIVAMENSSFSQIIGNSAAPYINSLANAGANFTNMHALSHPSLPNYLQFFSGSNQGITNDNCPPAGSPYTVPNLGKSLIDAGRTFKAFAENYPGNTTTCSSGNYLARHTPSVFFTGNLSASLTVDFSTFPTTSAGFSALPTVSLITPNILDDMHSGSTPIPTGDTWLQNNLGAYATWAQTHNSLLIVWWDEDNTNNVNPNLVPLIFYGAHVIQGQYNENINHYNVLSTVQTMYSAALSGNAATAAPITDAFAPQNPPSFNKIVMVVFENRGVNELIASQGGQFASSVPYLNTLANRGAVITKAYGLAHPSQPNYFPLYSGATQGVVDNTCPPPGGRSTTTGAGYTTSNLGADLIAAGKTFGGYAENIPTGGPFTCVDVNYDPGHCPWIRFSNLPMTNNHNFTAFPTTTAGYAALPTFSMVIPGVPHNMEGTNLTNITAGDTWLRTFFDPYVTWAMNNNSLLIVIFDEDQGHQAGVIPGGPNGVAIGGGNVPCIFAGANVVPGIYTESAITNTLNVAGVDHYNILRTVEDSLSLPHTTITAAASPITDIFATGPTISASVQLLQRVADGTEPTNFIVTGSSPGFYDAVITTVTGENSGAPNDPVPSVSGTVNSSNTVITVPGITTATSGDILVWYGMSSAPAQGAGTTSVPSPITIPAGFTSGFTQVNSTGVNVDNTGVRGGYKTQLAAGPTGNQNGSISPANVNAGLLVGITAQVSSGNVLGVVADNQVLFPVVVSDPPGQPVVSVSGTCNVTVNAPPGTITNISGVAINGVSGFVTVTAQPGQVQVPVIIHESNVQEIYWQTDFTTGTQMPSQWAIIASGNSTAMTMQWNALQRIFPVCPVSWETLDGVVSRQASSWQLTQRYSSKKAVKFNIASTILTTQKAVAFKVKNRVTASVASTWNLNKRVKTTKKRILWGVGIRNSAIHQELFNTGALHVAPTKAIAFKVFDKVSAMQACNWVYVSRRKATRRSTWMLKKAFNTSNTPLQQPIAFNAKKRVTSSQPCAWALQQRVRGAKKRILWNTLARVADK